VIAYVVNTAYRFSDLSDIWYVLIKIAEFDFLFKHRHLKGTATSRKKHNQLLSGTFKFLLIYFTLILKQTIFAYVHKA